MNERMCVVLCVESGALESLSVRAVESLRLFGGRFRDAAVLAVTPRRGAALSGWTRARFLELGVEHLRLVSRSGFSWYHYLNKPVALAAAEERTNAELIAFLDSDTIVLREPMELALDEGKDFAASVSDIELGGTTGPGHPNEAAWAAICALVGIEPDDLPWVEAPIDRVRMRLYFNSGVMVYRRSANVGSQQLELLTRVFRDRIRLPGSASRMVEQVVLAPLVVGRSLRWTTLPFHHNSTMISALPYNAEQFRDARIVHYHDSMSPRHWGTFLRHAEVEHPDAAEWLRDRGPVTSPSSAPARAVAEFYRLARGARRRIEVALDRGDRSVG